MICDRCGWETMSHIVSKFNTETICFNCSDEERLAPNYRKACETEEAACRAGNYNYPGIGLAPEDRAFLKAKRENR